MHLLFVVFEDTELKTLKRCIIVSVLVLCINTRTLCKLWEWHLGRDRMTLSTFAPFPWMSRWSWENDAGRECQAQTPNLQGWEHQPFMCLANLTWFSVAGSEISKIVGSLGYPELENRARKCRKGDRVERESCTLTEQTVEAMEGLKVCLLFPDTLFTVGCFPFGRAHCKRRHSQRFRGLDPYHITVFFPGLLTDTISWSCSSLGKVNSGKSRSLLNIQSLGRQNHGDGLSSHKVSPQCCIILYLPV